MLLFVWLTPAFYDVMPFSKLLFFVFCSQILATFSHSEIDKISQKINTAILTASAINVLDIILCFTLLVTNFKLFYVINNRANTKRQ